MKLLRRLAKNKRSKESTEIDILRVTKCPNNTYNVYLNGCDYPVNYHMQVLRSFEEVIDFITGIEDGGDVKDFKS